MAFYPGLRGSWQAFIRSGVTRGLTATQTLKAGIAGGLKTYRRTDYLADFREAADIPKKMPAIKAVRHDYRIGKELYGKGGPAQFRKFRYQVEVKVYNPETKYKQTFVTNVVSDRELTPGEIHAEALEPIRASTEAYKSEVRSYVLEAAFHKEGAFWD